MFIFIFNLVQYAEVIFRTFDNRELERFEIFGIVIAKHLVMYLEI